MSGPPYCLVTGAAGFLGSHLIELLDKESDVVIPVVRAEAPYKNCVHADMSLFGEVFDLISKFRPTRIIHLVEKDLFSLMRMVQVNVIDTIRSIRLSSTAGAEKYFCVSTDKAANPVSKQIMEMFLLRESQPIPISTARFANVAFSDGSLLYGFQRCFEDRQPIPLPMT